MKKRMRVGVDKALEAEADRLLGSSIESEQGRQLWAYNGMIAPLKPGTTVAPRLRREVYVPGGVPDASLRRGMFNRALNPRQTHLNSVDAHQRPGRN